MNKKDVLSIILLIITFAGLLFVKKEKALTYSFNPDLTEKYLRSQDIEDTKDEIKDRVFLSDSELYIASGYLYAQGESPVKYNFQHPPLIKYLYGFSVKLFNNPLFVQIAFGAVLLVLTYTLGIKVFKDRLISYGASLLLVVDPVFLNMLNEALLDLGQAAFSLLFTIAVLFHPASVLFQGISLGLFAASKFWSTTLFFIATLYGYKFFKEKEINIRHFVLTLFVAFFVFSLTYLKVFLDEGVFNIFFHQGKMLKFMLTHNAAALVGGPIVLFLTGYFSEWWEEGVRKAVNWTILWPVILFNSLFEVVRIRKLNQEFVIYLLPVLYLLYISAQVPFTRYFIVVLPYFYLGLAASIKKMVLRISQLLLR